MKARQRGIATVEFAVIGAALLLVLFSVIEIGRALFVWNSIAESTRRAARLAVVCPVDHAAVVRAALLNGPDGDANSAFLAGLTAANVSVEYLNSAGGAAAVFDDIRFVRVSITGYEHNLMIPFLMQPIEVPAFHTTLPVESLGYVPDIDARQCFGS